MRNTGCVTTMSDLARMAGVSVTTVSHVLNQTRPVNEGTARAVYDAVRATGYVPNTLARSLVQSRTMTIGVAIPTISNRYFSELTQSIERAARAARYSVVLADTEDDIEIETRAVRDFRARRVDGFILAPSSFAGTGGLDPDVHGSMPIVQIDRLADARFDAVGVDNAIAGDLVRHLVEHGHRRIALIAGRATVATVVERSSAYRDALLASGLEFDENLIRTGTTSVKMVREAVADLLLGDDPPTAFVAANNVITIGLMRSLKEAGRRVPDDIALVGFDDFDWSELVSPSLTTVAHPREYVGAKAVELLLERIDSPALAPREFRLSGAVHLRQSCGCQAT